MTDIFQMQEGSFQTQSQTSIMAEQPAQVNGNIQAMSTCEYHTEAGQEDRPPLPAKRPLR